MFHVVDGKTFKKINSTHFEYTFGYYNRPVNDGGPQTLVGTTMAALVCFGGRARGKWR
jgi:hypothetical protein